MTPHMISEHYAVEKCNRLLALYSTVVVMANYVMKM